MYFPSAHILTKEQSVTSVFHNSKEFKSLLPGLPWDFVCIIKKETYLPLAHILTMEQCVIYVFYISDVTKKVYRKLFGSNYFDVYMKQTCGHILHSMSAFQNTILLLLL